MKQNKAISRAVLARLLTCCALALAGVLVLTVVYSQSETKDTNGDLHWKTRALSEDLPEKRVDGRFQFLFHMNKSMTSHYQGGDAQWVGFKRSRNDYLNPEEVAFGNSLNCHQSQMSLGTLRIKGGGLRVPHWNLNSNIHGFVAQGTVWIGVTDDRMRPVTYTATTGKVIFLPRNTLYWIKNTGRNDCIIVLFFTTQEKPSYLDLDDLFYSIPKDLLGNMFEHRGGMKFIEQFKRPNEHHPINLPPNLHQLTKTTTYQQSGSTLANKYCLDLEGTLKILYSGGAEMQWSWSDSDQPCFHDDQKIFSESLLEYPDSLNVGKLRVPAGACLLPHHFNANQNGYVLNGCGKVGVFGSEMSDFEIGAGDALFLPAGTLYYINNTCTEELTLVLAHSVSSYQSRFGYKQNARKMVDAVFLDEYLDSLPASVLAQTFLSPENSFVKIQGGNHTKKICTADVTGRRISTVAPHQSTVSNVVTTINEDVVINNSDALTSKSNTFDAISPKYQAPAGGSNEDNEIVIIHDPDAVTPKHQAPASGSNEDNEIVIIHDPDAVTPKHQAPASGSNEDNEIVIIHDPDAVTPKHQAPASGSNEDNEIVIIDDLDAVTPKYQAPASGSNEDNEIVIIDDPDAVYPKHQAPATDFNKDNESEIVIIDDHDAVYPKHQAPATDFNKDNESEIVIIDDPDAVYPKHQAPATDFNKDNESEIAIIEDPDAVNPKHQAPASDFNEDNESETVVILDPDAVNPKH